MRIENEIKLGLKDVMFRPKRSTLKSRSQVSLDREFTFLHSQTKWTGVPIMAANMDTVGTFSLALALAKYNLFTAIHKHYSFEAWDAFLAEAPEGIENYIAVSTGTGANDGEKLKMIFDKEEKNYTNYGADLVFNGVATSNNNTVSKINSTTQAIFAQTMVPLTKQLELTLGGRYQKIKKDIDLNAKTYYYSTLYSTNEYNDKRTWNVFIPKVAVNYKLNNEFSFFASMSKGYMPGGFNTVATTSNEEDNRFDSEKSTDYEIGVKSNLDNFTFTASLFRMNIEDIHVYRRLS